MHILKLQGAVFTIVIFAGRQVELPVVGVSPYDSGLFRCALRCLPLMASGESPDSAEKGLAHFLQGQEKHGDYSLAGGSDRIRDENLLVGHPDYPEDGQSGEQKIGAPHGHPYRQGAVLS